jgi:hypothetical protein
VFQVGFQAGLHTWNISFETWKKVFSDFSGYIPGVSPGLKPNLEHTQNFVFLYPITGADLQIFATSNQTSPKLNFPTFKIFFQFVFPEKFFGKINIILNFFTRLFSKF